MPAPRVFRWLAFFFAILIVMVIIAADLDLIPGLLNPIYAFPNGDKIAHFLLMGTLSMLISLGFKNERTRFLGIRRGTLLLAILITLEECSQIYFENRKFSITDMMANWGGILIMGELGSALRSVIARRGQNQAASETRTSD